MHQTVVVCMKLFNLTVDDRTSQTGHLHHHDRDGTHELPDNANLPRRTDHRGAKRPITPVTLLASATPDLEAWERQTRGDARADAGDEQGEPGAPAWLDDAETDPMFTKGRVNAAVDCESRSTLTNLIAANGIAFVRRKKRHR
jgi:hypothetical protein